MRIVFVGAVDFSRHCLEEILKNKGDVVAVVTLAKEDARFNADYADLSPVAERHGIPIHRIKKINDLQTVALLRSLHPDIVFVLGWSQLVSKAVLDIPPLGCIGAHPTLLPRNRGRHPLIWALVEGLSESGLTFFFLDEGVDSGDILWQKPFPIAMEDDASTLYAKAKSLASEAIKEFLPQLQKGNAPRIPQRSDQATYWRKRTEKDGEIQWNSPSQTIYNLVRALTHPYVGSHTFHNGAKVRIWRVALSIPSARKPTSGVAGTVLGLTGRELQVKTGDGSLRILEYETENGQIPNVGSLLG